jgi:hypothetical protein
VSGVFVSEGAPFAGTQIFLSVDRQNSNAPAGDSLGIRLRNVKDPESGARHELVMGNGSSF